MSSLNASYNAENTPTRRFRLDDDFDAYTPNVDVSDFLDTACPFDGSLTCNSRSGCMVCDDGAQCCKKGETCSVSVEAQTPCPFVSYMPSCMMCDNERGEPTLVSAKPGDTCKATNMCSTFSAIAKYDIRDTYGDNIPSLSSGSGVMSHAPSFMVGSRGGAGDVDPGLTTNYTKRYLNKNLQHEMQRNMYAASMQQNHPHEESALRELRNRERRRLGM